MPVIQAESFPNGEKPLAKGRNGYFNLARIIVETFSTNVGAPEVMLQFMSERSVYPGPAYARITPETARELGQALIDQADVVEKGDLPCP